MFECIFTIDYEIYGNGEGSLLDLIYEPAEKLKAIFQVYGKRFVVFVEVAELEMIEAKGVDPAIDMVKQQIRAFHEEGFEIGLHVHPQWYNGRCEGGSWLLDYSEYNLCTLPRERVVKIVDRSIDYLRRLLGQAVFTPFSFRAGNWLFQPTQIVANVLAERGVKVDSSVFKGGMQGKHKLDYRRAVKNGYFWKFDKDVNIPNVNGELVEIPIYTQMVPFWKMLTGKRVKIQQKASTKNEGSKERLYRIMDFLRFRHPLKFDFCRMTIDEITGMVDKVVREDQEAPDLVRPIVAIGHTKDLIDFRMVESFLAYLDQKRIPVSTFEEVYEKCVNALES